MNTTYRTNHNFQIHHNKLYNTYLTNNQYKIHNLLRLPIHISLLYNMTSCKQYPIYHKLSTMDQYKLAEKGKYRYTLSIERDQREIEWRDNLQSAEVTAASELRRVLLMAGHATNEYRFLRNLAIRDDGIQVSCWLSSADTEYPQDGDILITELPQTSEELREYDVVLMLDPQPSTVTPALQDALVDFVTEQGGGLAFVAGEINTHALARADRFKKLRALLPVELASARAPFSGRIFDKGWLPTLTARGRSHSLCRLSNEPVDNLELWQRLPPFYFWYQATRLRPGGLSLLQKESDIIAATHRLGFAEVFYLGTDDFWRWRAGEVGIHERFWAVRRPV